MEIPIELAEGLKNSNITEVSALATAYLDLRASYDELQHKYVMATSEIVMIKHAKLFKKLAESGD